MKDHLKVMAKSAWMSKDKEAAQWALDKIEKLETIIRLLTREIRRQQWPLTEGYQPQVGKNPGKTETAVADCNLEDAVNRLKAVEEARKIYGKTAWNVQDP